MASRGRGRRGRPRGTSQAPPVFDQEAFIEAMGAAISTATQVDVARGQGGASNFQRFKAHHPPMFTGGGDPMVADHWFRQIERILRAMEITSDTTRITLLHSRLWVSPRYGGSGSRLPGTWRLCHGMIFVGYSWGNIFRLLLDMRRPESSLS